MLTGELGVPFISSEMVDASSEDSLRRKLRMPSRAS